MDEVYFNNMTISDLLAAVQATWGDEVPVPPQLSQGIMQEIVKITSEANRNAGRVMGHGATIAWGISIGIHAERNRLKRITQS